MHFRANIKIPICNSWSIWRRKTESVQVPIDNPKIVNRMFDLHISELKYSIEELTDIVGLMPDEIKTELLNENTSVSIKPRKIMLNF